MWGEAGGGTRAPVRRLAGLVAPGALCALLLSAGCGGAPASPEEPDGLEETSLRSLAGARGLRLGTEVWWDPLQSDATYQEILAREFGAVIPGDFFRWDRIHPEPGAFDFTQLDALAAAARRDSLELQMGHLLWHPTPWLPLWYVLEIAERESGRSFTRPLSDAEQREVQEILAGYAPTQEDRARTAEILRGFVGAVVSRYRGRVVAWNVVNEALADPGEGPGPLRESFWSRMLGDDLFDVAFHAAREADPGALLLLNEYGAEGTGPKADRLAALVSRLRSRGVPVDAVGLQMHVLPGGAPTAADVRSNIRRLAALGVEVWITEMDVRLRLPASEDDRARQAARFREILAVCLEEAACTGFVTWGFTDRYSWVPDHFPGFGDALLFDRAYRAKPAYVAVREVLAGR